MSTAIEKKYFRLGFILVVLFTQLFEQLTAQETIADHFFEFNNVHLRYISYGEGQPVVLIHPFASSLEDYNKNGILSLIGTKGFRAIAYDTRGHGQSDKPHGPKNYGLSEVEELAHLLNHLGELRVHLVGYSHGAEIALGFFVTYPERVLTLTIGGFGYDGQTTGPIEILYKDPKIAEALSTNKIEPLLKALTPPGQPLPPNEIIEGFRYNLTVQNNPKALAASLLGAKQIPKPTPEQLKSNTVPVLAIVGEYDWLFNEIVYKMSGTTKNMEVLVIPNADHLSTFWKPEFKTGLIGFISKHSED